MEREVGPPYDFPEDIRKLGPGEVNRPLPWSELNPVQRDFQAAKMAIHAAMDTSYYTPDAYQDMLAGGARYATSR